MAKKDKTALFESSQALFCAIADFLGAKKSEEAFDYENYTEFRRNTAKAIIDTSYKRIKTPGITMSDIDVFLTNNKSWYESSVNIAKKLIKDITKIDPDFSIADVGFEDLYYFRGDDKVMGNIFELWKIAKESPITKFGQIKFGDINKWSPADIYLASNIAKQDIAKQLKNALANKKSYSFINLNTLVSDLIDSGDLLPLSLKKKTTEDVKLEKVNFDKKKELQDLKSISISKQGVTDWKPYKRVAFGQTSETRDMRVFLNNNGEIKFRHDPSAKRFVAEFIGKGAEARAGSIGSIKVFCELMRFVDRGTADKLLKAYQDGDKEFKKLLPGIQDLRKDEKRFNFERGSISALTVTNRILPILKKWFTRGGPKAAQEIDAFVKILYSYITSRSPLSGKFVIAK